MNCKIMKRVIINICLASAAVIALASCDKNLPAKFDDKDAFVAFEKTSYSVSEDYSVKDGAIFRIPVTLASAAGIETSVKYEITAPDSWQATVPGQGAIEGVDYELVDNSGVLSFNAENRTRYIEFKTMANGVYTGDLEFSIEVFGNDDIQVGSENKCTVKLSDVDHPLTFMLGEYNATALSYFNGSKTGVLEIRKDAEDVHKVWFYNMYLIPGWAADDILYYGIVNDEKTEIVVPFGQTSEYLYQKTTPLTLRGIYDEEFVDSGSLTIAVTDNNGTVSLNFGDYGFAIQIGDLGQLEIIKPGMTAVKK